MGNINAEGCSGSSRIGWRGIDEHPLQGHIIRTSMKAMATHMIAWLTSTSQGEATDRPRAVEALDI
jgi:hypothetical protein